MRQAERLRYLVLAAQREGNRALGQQLASLELTPSQAEALRILQDYGPLTLGGLGELLVCESGTNPSRLVDRLVSAGHVTRDIGAHDRRQVELNLTAQGRNAADAVSSIENALYEGIDAATAHLDLSVTLALLESLVAGQPSGIALEKRR